jgi:hypothetical protein
MGRPVSGYYTKDGTRVPSVTEVLGKFKNADPLVGWAFKLGKESGIAMAQGRPAPRSAHEAKTQAGQAGQIAHDMIESHWKGETYVYEGPRLAAGIMQRAQQGYQNARRWLENTKYEILDTETTLVSERYGFGGTRDVKFKVPGGGRRLGDWKTSNSVYADYLIQVAAYDLLAEECEGETFEGYDICRFSKEYGDFEHKSFNDLGDAKAAFLLMVQLYPLVTRLEDRV